MPRNFSSHTQHHEPISNTTPNVTSSAIEHSRLPLSSRTLIGPDNAPHPRRYVTTYGPQVDYIRSWPPSPASTTCPQHSCWRQHSHGRQRFRVQVYETRLLQTRPASFFAIQSIVLSAGGRCRLGFSREFAVEEISVGRRWSFCGMSFYHARRLFTCRYTRPHQHVFLVSRKGIHRDFELAIVPFVTR